MPAGPDAGLALVRAPFVPLSAGPDAGRAFRRTLATILPLSTGPDAGLAFRRTWRSPLSPACLVSDRISCTDPMELGVDGVP